MLERAGDGTVLKVEEATTLLPHQTVVKAVIPLADANSYAITLPKVADGENREFVIFGIRASGSYVDGVVTVQDADDGIADNYASSDLTANGDHVVVKNFAGRFYREIVERTT
jgi:hypothetical protein